MKFSNRVSDHVERFQRQMGKTIELGRKRYAVKGYISNILSVKTEQDWEPELNRVFADVLKNQGYFLDVGMNLGQTLGRVLAVDPDRQYLGFEPQVFACAMVDLFIRQNQLTNCITLPIGLSDENGVKSFFSIGDADTMATLHERDDALKSNIPVRIGDEVVKELGIDAVCAIKIDVEGAEPEVIAGLSGTIRTFRPQIIFEVLPNFEGESHTPVSDTVAEQRRSGAGRIMRLLEELDYEVYQPFTDGTEKRIRAFDLDSPSTFSGTNFTARPG